MKNNARFEIREIDGEKKIFDNEFGTDIPTLAEDIEKACQEMNEWADFHENTPLDDEVEEEKKNNERFELEKVGAGVYVIYDTEYCETYTFSNANLKKSEWEDIQYILNEKAEKNPIVDAMCALSAISRENEKLENSFPCMMI